MQIQEYWINPALVSSVSNISHREFKNWLGKVVRTQHQFFVRDGFNCYRFYSEDYAEVLEWREKLIKKVKATN